MQTLRDSTLECARDFTLLAAAKHVVDHTLQQRTKIEFSVVQRKRICIGCGRVGGNSLEPHRSLAFKRYGARETEQRSRAVEQTPHGGSGERTNVSVHQLQSSAKAQWERERRNREVPEFIESRQKTGSCLNWLRGSRIAAGQNGGSQMSDALEASAHAADKNLAAPDGSIIAVARAVETDTDDLLVPCSTLRKDGSDVGAVMLHSAPLRCGEFRSMERRDIVGMRIVRDQQVTGIDFVHGKQIADGFAESAERFVMTQVADVLADEGLAIHDQGDRIF